MTTKSELVNVIVANAGLTRTQAKNALEAFVAAVTASLRAGG